MPKGRVGLMAEEKLKVVIFDISEGHQDFLYTLSLLSLKSGFDVVVFTTLEIRELVFPLIRKYYGRIEWHIYTRTDGIVDYLQKLRKYVNRQKCVLFIGTLYYASIRLLALFSLFSVKRPMYLCVGRTYFWFEGDPTRTLFKQMVKLLLMKSIIRKFDGIIIHSEKDFDYLQKRNYQKKILFLPWYLKDVSEPSFAESVEVRLDYITFAIVGNIQEIRRDYLGVLKVFERLWEGEYAQFHLDLIGTPKGEYGEKIIKLCESFLQKGYPVRFAREFLNTETFLERISKCDCLIAPMNVNYYARNQSSAVITEQIRFDKTAILPSFYKVPELGSSTLYYEEIQEIEHLIIDNFCDVDNIKRLQDEGRLNSQKFAFEKYIQNFNEFVR